MRVGMALASIVLLVVVLAGGTASVQAASPAVHAAPPVAPVMALSAAEMADLATREKHAGPLSSFRAGDADVATTIAAWTGAGLAVPAFILALLAL